MARTLPLHPLRTLVCLAATLLALPALPAMAQAGHAHVHGVARLDIAIEDETLDLTLEAPLDTLLGYERAPRIASERKAADAALNRLHDPRTLWALHPSAQCQLVDTQIASPVLQAAAEPAGSSAASQPPGDTHGDLEAHYTYRCTRTDVLTSLDVAGLLDAFKRIGRIEAQVVAPAGQFKPGLQRPDRVLQWGR